MMYSAASQAHAFAGLEVQQGVPPYPVHYDVPAPERPLRRLRTAFRPVLLLPALVVCSVLQMLASLVTVVAWLVLLFSGRYEPGLRRPAELFMERMACYLTSLTLLRDELPPLGGGEYPTVFWVDYPARQSRLSVFFRYLLLLPLYFMLQFAIFPWLAVVVIAWFAILFTGRYPEGLRRLMIGLNRWLLRVQAYALLLRDEFPGFTLGFDELPVAPTAAGVPQQASFAWKELVWNSQELPHALAGVAELEHEGPLESSPGNTAKPTDEERHQPGFVSRPPRPTEPPDAG
jgi:hypothetical protein